MPSSSARKKTVGPGPRSTIAQEQAAPVSLSSAAAQRLRNARATLNEAQKAAVQRIDGPLMVIAGPGTGKTQVIALRVAEILERTQVNPSNILCLTFSTAGAKAMRERLRSFIGPAAYAVTVGTVHSFCNDLILQHPQLFEDFRALEQISDIERLRTIRRLLKDLSPGSVLGRVSVDGDRAAAILSRITEMKREGIDPAALRNHLAVYREEIKTTPTGKERDPTSKAYKDDLRNVQQFAEFIELYEGYLAELPKHHRYDYEDMILFTIRALQENEWLLTSLQERFHYILIDEFQDLNGAQNSLIELLVRYPSADQEPNIAVVGDDDQAIYRFQGANIGNMLGFLERFPGATIITLTENYRSTTPILHTAMTVIENGQERLVRKVEGISKNLTAAALEHGVQPRLLRYPDAGTEIAGVIDELRRSHEEGVAWDDMAVLCRRNEEVQTLGEMFAAAEIPAIVEAKRDLLAEDVVRDAIALLEAVRSPDDDAILSTALTVPALGCHPTDLARLWIGLRKRRQEHPDEKINLRELLLERSESLDPCIGIAHDLIERLHGSIDRVTLPALLEDLLRDSQLLPQQDEKSADPRKIAAIHAFYDYIKKRCYEQKALTLDGLLEDLHQYRQDAALTLHYDTPHLTRSGVHIMTAHAAKGLEFEVVAVPHVRLRNWGDRIGGGGSLKLPDHLIYGIDREVEKRASQEDERRLFYVALTRARRMLLLTFAERYRSGDDLKDAQLSSFVAEAGDSVHESRPTEVSAPPEVLRRPPIVIDDVFRAFLLERLENFELSVTALNAFLRDPLEFLWAHLLQQPQAKIAHLAYGSSVHRALEERNLAWREGRSFSTEDLLATFRQTMEQRELFTERERAEYLHRGIDVLQRYGRQTEDARPFILSAERTIRAQLPSQERPYSGAASEGSIPLVGKVDRIDLFVPDGRECQIIDYKTGKPKATAEAVRKEGDLFRQLVFYKILCDRAHGFIHEAKLFTLDFVGDDREDRRVIDFQITQEESQQLEQTVRSVWSKITQLDFSPIEA